MSTTWFRMSYLPGYGQIESIAINLADVPALLDSIESYEWKYIHTNVMYRSSKSMPMPVYSYSYNVRTALEGLGAFIGR